MLQYIIKETSRFAVFPAATLCGAAKKFPKENHRIISADIVGEPVYQKYAGEPYHLLPEILEVVDKRDITVGEMPYKLQALAFHACFTDMHSLPLPLKIDERDARTFISKVFYKNDISGRAVTMPEQVELALDVTHNNLAQASTILAVATRHMARAQDFRQLPIPLNRQIMWEWKRAVNDPICSSDPTGDAYHFFGTFLVGLARENDRQALYDKLSGSLCDLIVDWTPGATEALRYKIMGHEGMVHETDIPGYAVGRELMKLKTWPKY